MPVALLIGNEGKGISPLLKKNCDFTLSIPMARSTDSLNASAAGAVVFYEALRQKVNRKNRTPTKKSGWIENSSGSKHLSINPKKRRWTSDCRFSLLLRFFLLSFLFNRWFFIKPSSFKLFKQAILSQLALQNFQCSLHLILIDDNLQKPLPS